MGLPRPIRPNGYRRYSVEQRSLDLLAYLQETGGANLSECADALGWSTNAVRTAIQHAREHVCPQLKLAIPHPVPQDEFRYHLTGDWISSDHPAIEEGTAFALAQVESRLRSIYRDVQIALANIDHQSIPGRKANFLNRRLGHIFETLHDIGASTTRESA